MGILLRQQLYPIFFFVIYLHFSNISHYVYNPLMNHNPVVKVLKDETSLIPFNQREIMILTLLIELLKDKKIWSSLSLKLLSYEIFLCQHDIIF